VVDDPGQALEVRGIGRNRCVDALGRAHGPVADDRQPAHDDVSDAGLVEVAQGGGEVVHRCSQTSMQITLLGVPSVTRDGERAVLDTRKALALIAHLALSERPRPREALCDLLWPEHDASHARGALRRTLSTVRGAIGDDGVQASSDSVALQRGPDLEIDVECFRRLAAEGASTDDLGAAVAQYSGRFLDGFALRDSVEFDDWQGIQAEVLSRELGSALRRLVAGLVQRGEHEPALAHARRWLELDALHEPAHRELIRLHALTGDRAAALEQYRDCVRTLSRELGVSPLQETAELYEQVNDGSLTPPAQAAQRPPAASGSVPAPLQLPLVGRERELAALAGAHAASRPEGRLAVIEGEAGIGKTRLFEELARRAIADGAVVLAVQCHDDEAGLPYGPVVELLRAALRRTDSTDEAWPAAVAPQRLADAALLLPELAALRPDTPAPLPLDGPGARVRLLEAVAAVVSAACAGRSPGIVFFDDVHGADEATIDAISYLSRRLEGRALLLVVSWRSEAVQPGHRLRRLAVDAARAGTATIVSPVRLTQDEVGALVQAARPGTPEAGLQRRVYLESEGLPLFVAQYLAAQAGGGTPAHDGLPADVQGFLRRQARRPRRGRPSGAGSRCHDRPLVRSGHRPRGERPRRRGARRGAGGVAGAGRRPRGRRIRARLRLLTPEAALAGLRRDEPRAPATAAPPHRGRPVEGRRRRRARRAGRQAPAPCL